MEGRINVTTFVVLSTMFSVLTKEHLLVKGGCPHRDVGCATGVGLSNKWDSGDEGILIRRQDDPEVAVLAPSTGTLN